MTALAQLDKDAKASGKTREEVLNEYVGFVLPSIDPEQFGDGKSAIPSFNVPGLKSYSPSREYYLRNLDEGVIQDLRKNMNMYQTLVTSEGGIFRKRDLSTDEAYELAKSTTAGIQGFDINEDGVVEDSEIRVAISSYQDAYVSELNYLKFQIENNTNLAIASVVMTDNVDLVDKGLLVPLEVGGVKYNVTPRQLQMFGYFRRCSWWEHYDRPNEYQVQRPDGVGRMGKREPCLSFIFFCYGGYYGRLVWNCRGRYVSNE